MNLAYWDTNMGPDFSDSDPPPPAKEKRNQRTLWDKSWMRYYSWRVPSEELESLRSKNENEDEYELCPSEVWYFAVVLAFALKSNFALFTLFFSVRVFEGKNGLLYLWRTYFKKKTFWWLLMSWKQKIHICKSRSREDTFSKNLLCRRATHNEFPAYVTRHGQLCTWNMTKQSNSRSPSF